MINDDDDKPETMLVPATRFLVGSNLGPVRKGDHVLMIGNVIVALDTSRPFSSVHVPSRPQPMHQPPHSPQRLMPPTKKSYKGLPRRSPSEVTTEKVLAIIKTHGPISSRSISDKLTLSRDDTPCRSKVTHILTDLRARNLIKPYEEGRTKIFRYIIIDELASTNITSQ